MALKKASETASTYLVVVANWLSARATVVLAVLMVQIGMLLALYNLYATSDSPRMAATSRGVHQGCGALEVVFAPQADFASVRRWALNFDAQIVAGPNARGAFELVMPQMDIADVQQTLGPLATQVRANPLCPARGPG